MSVIVTDGSNKHALCAVRSLGRKGIEVGVCSDSRGLLTPLVTPSFWSRYCTSRFASPRPKNERAYAEFMLGLLRKRHYDVLLPIGYNSTRAVSSRKPEFERLCKVPIADWETIGMVSAKTRCLQFAQTTGVKVPHWEAVTSVSAAERLARRFAYPAVLKSDLECVGRKVIYVNDEKEFVRGCREKLSQREGGAVIAQEYVGGQGYGFFALYNHGKVRATFAHKRVREFPITGGTSSAAESVYDRSLERQGRRLLDKLKWHGVAMVEFKRDSQSGEFKLMEINPKFWGSLDLAVASGVNFPYLAYRMALDGDVKQVTGYRRGLRYQWVLYEDTLNMLYSDGLSGAGQYFRDIADPAVAKDLDASDPLPVLFHAGLTLVRLAVGKRHPHGKVSA